MSLDVKAEFQLRQQVRKGQWVWMGFAGLARLWEHVWNAELYYLGVVYEQ